MALVIALPGGSLIYEAGNGSACARCHEIRHSYEMWANSTHRSVPCEECHGGALTLDVGFHAGNLRRVVEHVRGSIPQQILLVRPADIDRATAACRKCHEQEYTKWKASTHSATYAEIFLDREHNSEEALIDDCLRCHGMHYQGGIQDLVTPLNTKGPWKLKVPELAGQPAMPCLACHAIHRPGKPLGPHVPGQMRPAAGGEIAPPSLALFDRRTQGHIGALQMPIPQVFDGQRKVTMSPDPRQGLCYQCHAPEPDGQAGSGDDRTGVGVHEGISCLACHDHHTQDTRASCAGCHPRLSNCGLDVEKMDTTFLNPESAHNIHTVKCADCHSKGVPPRRQLTAARRR